MVPFLRNAFNLAFSKKAYESFLLDIESKYLNALDFRVAETPIFVDKAFKDKILETCESIVDTIVSTDFKQLSEAAIPFSEKIPKENKWEYTQSEKASIPNEIVCGRKVSIYIVLNYNECCYEIFIGY